LCLYSLIIVIVYTINHRQIFVKGNSSTWNIFLCCNCLIIKYLCNREKKIKKNKLARFLNLTEPNFS
jgi:hypothetical protein